MTHTEAFAEAQKRWGSCGFVDVDTGGDLHDPIYVVGIMLTPTPKSPEQEGRFRVLDLSELRETEFVVFGKAPSWEVAFQNADRGDGQ